MHTRAKLAAIFSRHVTLLSQSFHVFYFLLKLSRRIDAAGRPGRFYRILFLIGLF